MPPVIKLIHGDIVELEVDALVTAANPQLAGGGGVDGAVHHGAGPKLLEACQELYRESGECQPGHAVITSGYDLKAKYVIHTVGPIWSSDLEEESKEKLYLAYQRSLKIAYENDCQSIAFPNISTGVYGFPKLAAAYICLSAIKKFCVDNPQVKDILQEIYLVCFDEENHQVYCEIFS